MPLLLTTALLSALGDCFAYTRDILMTMVERLIVTEVVILRVCLSIPAPIESHAQATVEGTSSLETGPDKEASAGLPIDAG